MKALISVAAILVAFVASYSGERIMDVHSKASGIVSYNISDIDSLTFREKPWAPGDTFVDSRDHQKYATVVLGTQCWMAENLNIGTLISGSSNQLNNSIIEKYAYNDNTAYADTFGGLYQWNEAMGYDTNIVQGICPNGWHMPTDAEWTTLVTYEGGASAAGTALKTGGSSGFNALYAGFRTWDGTGPFNPPGSHTRFWTRTQGGPNHAYNRSMDISSAAVGQLVDGKTSGFCVRCVKDQD
jgi:uncharacterized protein (TIGR02145 family)